LHAIANGIDGPNGVYTDADGGGFPDKTFHSANYWVDVVFSTSTTPSGRPSAGHSVSLHWTASTSPDIAGYNVYRATESNGPYVLLNTAPVSGTDYVDDTVASDQTYFYVATAVDNNNNESMFSNEVVAAVPAP
jgi:hypothetical protein